MPFHAIVLLLAIIINFTMCLCNVSMGRVLQLIAMVIGCAGRARVQPKMWEFEILMRDSGMSCVFAGYSNKKAGWLVTMMCVLCMCVFICEYVCVCA